jgi:drug/metabolite transporter (DMT)-like permease
LILALVLGSTAALIWATSALLSAPVSRLAGPAQGLLWTSVIGCGTAVLFAAPSGLPDTSASDWALMTLLGVGYLAGISLFLVAVNKGKVSFVTPIVACDGAIGTLIAAATGATITASVALALAIMVAGILLVTIAGSAREQRDPGRFAVARMRPAALTAALAAGSATAFGVVFFASGEVDGLSPLWMVAIARAFPLVGGLAWSLKGRRLLPQPDAWKWLAAFGVIDTFGYLVYIWAAREDSAIAPIAASQYAALAVLGAVLVLRESLSRVQLGGVVVLLTGIALIASTGSGW